MPQSSALLRYSPRRLSSYLPIAFNVTDLTSASHRGGRQGGESDGGGQPWLFPCGLGLVFSICGRVNVLCEERKRDKGSGDLWTWGSGMQGQLGHGDYSSQASPRKVDAFEQLLLKSPVEKLSQCKAGSVTSACVTTLGRLFMWGRTSDSNASLQSLPKVIETFEEQGIQIVDFAVGDGFTIAVDSKGCVYSWGKSNRGQCGRPNKEVDTKDLWARRQLSDTLEIGRVEGTLAGKQITQLASGRSHSLALAEDGSVFTWGLGQDGQLGLGSRDDVLEPQPMDYLNSLPPPFPPPPQPSPPARVKQVAAGQLFSAAVTTDGRLFTWGSDDYGQLGHGQESRRGLTPKLVRGALQGKRVSAVSCGAYHIGAITEEGEVYVWGYGRDGETGHGEKSDIHIPAQVEALKGQRAVSISCGGGHTAVTTADGSLYMFGRGRDGQLGRGSDIESIAMYRTLPVVVEQFQQLKLSIASVTCGGDHTMAITTPA
ncbi:unnamed protein product [Vitrella brassicaformis CCMP3155]|uniref:RCC1-like domain-containing protein n=1 Tax=Vitrella brassicaformis (strain CCMP3155) TaxID=1169540 RepID=A0A0G4EU32_VITBC|nr:unnamed protein product [Vitrella brassicaformis CCMP3155]|eukprot:CEM01775.1 unnamed protein product [Vitrella brassicaformis CCMP3155]